MGKNILKKEQSIEIIRFPALKQKLGGVSRRTIERWVRNKKFPQPIKLGLSCVGWLVSDIESWIMSKWEDICTGEGKTTKGALKHAIRNLEKHLADAKKRLEKL